MAGVVTVDAGRNARGKPAARRCTRERDRSTAGLPRDLRAECAESLALARLGTETLIIGTTGVAEKNYAVLSKPFTPDKLIQKVQTILDGEDQ